MSLVRATARTFAAIALLGSLTACPGPVGDAPSDDEIRQILSSGLAEQLVSLATAGPLESADCALEGEIVRGEPREEYVDTLAETKMTFPVQVASICTGVRVTGESEEVQRYALGSWTYLIHKDQFDQWDWKAERN